MKNQLFGGLSFSQYQEIDALNMSLLTAILDSPGALQHLRDNPREVTDAMIMGSAIDCKVLEPELFPLQYTTAPVGPDELPDQFVPVPDGMLGKNGTSWLKAGAEWKAEQDAAGRIPHKEADWNGSGLKMSSSAGRAWRALVEAEGMRVLSHSDLARVEAAASKVLEHEIAEAMIEEGIKQATLVWQDEATGIWCKGRPDLYIPEVSAELSKMLRLQAAADAIMVPAPGEPFIPDLKSTGKGVDPDSVASLCFSGGWHRQGAHYCNGAATITGRPHDHAGIIAVAQMAPHRVETYLTPFSIMEQGRTEVAGALELYKMCADAGEWPSSSGKVHAINFKPWMTY